MRPPAFLLLALPLVSCSTPATGVPAPDVPPTTDRSAAVDAPSLTWRELAAVSSTPIRRFAESPALDLLPGSDYRAVVTTDAGELTLDLFEEAAPIAVNSFVWLARNHYYDGVAFHRVIEGFVAQGGDPNTVAGARNTWGTGGPGYTFGLEVSAGLRFDGPGVLGMARSTSPNSNGSQFYLTLAPTPNLDNLYTVFGRVLGAADLAVLDRVARGQPPATPTRITGVVILVGSR